MRNREGFTLIEMLAVIAIIAMLCAALGVGAWKMYEQIAVKAVRAEMQSVLSAMEEYYEDYGYYPSVLETPTGGDTFGLVIALHGYYDCSITVTGNSYWIDPWLEEIVYRLEDGRPLFKSVGPDLEIDTNDDIVER